MPYLCILFISKISTWNNFNIISIFVCVSSELQRFLSFRIQRMIFLMYCLYNYHSKTSLPALVCCEEDSPDRHCKQFYMYGTSSILIFIFNSLSSIWFSFFLSDIPPAYHFKLLIYTVFHKNKNFPQTVKVVLSNYGLK